MKSQLRTQLTCPLFLSLSLIRRGGDGDAKNELSFHYEATVVWYKAFNDEDIKIEEKTFLLF